jgi:hypothetical protein
MESSEPEAKRAERDQKKNLLMQRVALKDAAGEIFAEGGFDDPKNLEGVAHLKLRKLSSNLSMIASSREDLESRSGGYK